MSDQDNTKKKNLAPTDPNNKDSPGPSCDLTTALTDTESGEEGLSGEEDRKRSLKTLESMYERGLINESEYQSRRQELISSESKS